MKILSTKLTLHASGTLSLKPLIYLADKLGAEFLFMPAGSWPALVHLTTTFVCGSEIHAAFALDASIFNMMMIQMDDYAHRIKEELIQQTSGLVKNQIRDQIDCSKRKTSGIRFLRMLNFGSGPVAEFVECDITFRLNEPSLCTRIANLCLNGCDVTVEIATLAAMRAERERNNV